jgi:WD40 repeat protein
LKSKILWHCPFNSQVETVGFHPAAHGILATSSGTSITLWDLTAAPSAAADVFTWDGHGDRVQSVAWQWGAGRLLATQARDKMLRILDPRAGPAALVAEMPSHDGVKVCPFF